MADIHHNNQEKSDSKRRNASNRIDMTAMVDVAFLLLTFFILTTTLAKPKALELNKPVGDVDKINCEKMMTIYLGAQDQIYYVAGCDEQKVVTTNFSSKGIRQQLIREMHTRNDLIISIKRWFFGDWACTQ